MRSASVNVKQSAGRKPSWLRWIDAHPRTGWYVSSIVTLDLFLNLVNFFNCPLLH